jgi:ribosomal protein S18 acetylase RimI-like enzyme
VSLATPHDVGDLVTLMEEFYGESNYPLDRPWARTSFLELIARPALGCVWIARCDGAPAGHAVLTVRYAMEHGGLSGQVDDLFVRPTFRRLGAAAALLDALFAEARRRDCRSIQVEVGRDNAAAQRLYAHFGLRAYADGRELLALTFPSAGP